MKFAFFCIHFHENEKEDAKKNEKARKNKNVKKSKTQKK